MQTSITALISTAKLHTERRKLTEPNGLKNGRRRPIRYLTKTHTESERLCPSDKEREERAALQGWFSATPPKLLLEMSLLTKSLFSAQFPSTLLSRAAPKEVSCELWVLLS